ncbi:hypothetical protein L596_006242 [Steinernema carpocapsae]|uniref:Uncharacterized protein n=1 Tax=Steinernema carpocapsae TaxID=34508 RepID=A0A4U8V1K1_STECR|nr:hypothetical protein L596_006242 [Steinernema carpocapsae]
MLLQHHGILSKNSEEPSTTCLTTRIRANECTIVSLRKKRCFCYSTCQTVPHFGTKARRTCKQITLLLVTMKTALIYLLSTGRILQLENLADITFRHFQSPWLLPFRSPTRARSFATAACAVRVVTIKISPALCAALVTLPSGFILPTLFFMSVFRRSEAGREDFHLAGRQVKQLLFFSVLF